MISSTWYTVYNSPIEGTITLASGTWDWFCEEEGSGFVFVFRNREFPDEVLIGWAWGYPSCDLELIGIAAHPHARSWFDADRVRWELWLINVSGVIPAIGVVRQHRLEFRRGYEVRAVVVSEALPLGELTRAELQELLAESNRAI
jgi:hypothetical protein